MHGVGCRVQGRHTVIDEVDVVCPEAEEGESDDGAEDGNRLPRGTPRDRVRASERARERERERERENASESERERKRFFFLDVKAFV